MLGVNLNKGESVDLTKKNPGLAKIFVACGWDVKKEGETMDADLSAYLLTDKGTVRSPKDCIFFNNKGHKGDNIWHSGDNLTGAGDGDDEVINVDLSAIPSDIKKITFVLNIYQAASKHQTLADLDNAFIRAVNSENNQELAHLKVEGYTSGYTINFAHLVRTDSGWEFHADGSASNEDLSKIMNHYGVAA